MTFPAVWKEKKDGEKCEMRMMKMVDENEYFILLTKAAVIRIRSLEIAVKFCKIEGILEYGVWSVADCSMN